MGESYYCKFPGDYMRDTRHLSLMEHGAYNLLLDAYYSNGRPLPASIDALVRIVGAQGAAERKAVEAVADEFMPVGADGFRHQKKADRELLRRDEFAADQARKGRLSGEARRKPRLNHGSTAVEPRFDSGSTEREPMLNPPSPSPSPSPEPAPTPSVKPPDGRGGIAWSGSVLVVDGEAHAQFRRIYDEKWLFEQYPQIDVKLAVLSTPGDPWGRHRALGYCTTWLTRAKSAAPAAPPPDVRPKCSRCHADPATETGGLCRVCAKAVARRRQEPPVDAGEVARQILESLGAGTDDDEHQVAEVA